MKYGLSERFVLRLLEKPSLYDPLNDELYELDEKGFQFLRSCASAAGCDAEAADREFIDYCLSEGILTVEIKDRKRPPVVQSPVPSLRYLELQITDKCNLRCRHCYIGESGNRELSPDQFEAVLNEFEAMQGLRLLITGGEPLMHSRFEELNRMLPDYFFRKILFTNGLLLNEKILGSLNVHEIQFSVDGLEHGHEALRGKGTFRKVMAGIEAASAAGYQVSISTMVHKENLNEFEEMDRLFRIIGVRDWTVDVPCAKGNMKANDILAVPPETGGKLLDYGFGGGLHGGGEGFGCGLHLAAVLAGGEVCKCAFYSKEPAGHIGEGLGRAWSRITSVKLGELECARLACGVLEECRGGCRFRASAACGRPEIKDVARDLYKCFQYGIMK